MRREVVATGIGMADVVSPPLDLTIIRTDGVKVDFFVRKQSGAEIGETELKLIDSHLMMLCDPDFIERVNKQVRTKKKNVEWVLLKVVEETVEKLNASEDDYFKERINDVHDAPTLASSVMSVDENTSLSTVIGNVGAGDEDDSQAPNGQLSYQITDGNALNKFTIDGNGNILLNNTCI